MFWSKNKWPESQRWFINLSQANLSNDTEQVVNKSGDRVKRILSPFWDKNANIKLWSYWIPDAWK